MLKISSTACPCLSQLVSAQFALEMLSQPEIAKKSIKPSVQCHPRSLNSVAIESQYTTSYHRLNGSSSPVLTATSLSYGKAKNSTPAESKPLI